MRSDQKVAIVTAALGGVGASLVRGIRELGYSIVAKVRQDQGGDMSVAAKHVYFKMRSVEKALQSTKAYDRGAMANNVS